MRDAGIGVAGPGEGVPGRDVVVTHVSSRTTRAAGRAPAGPSSRTTFAVGRLTWRTRDIRLVERLAGSGVERGSAGAAARIPALVGVETVH